MNAVPTADELLEIVAQFLRVDVAGNRNTALNFYAIVAANAVDIVRRELEHGAATEAANVDRLRQLLNTTEGSAHDLERQLAAAIREGLSTGDSPGLLEHLWLSTLAQVAIDQPRHATYRLLKGTPPTGVV